MIQGIPLLLTNFQRQLEILLEVVETAEENKRWSVVGRIASMYLMTEECHPMMYDLEVDKPNFSSRLIWLLIFGTTAQWINGDVIIRSQNFRSTFRYSKRYKNCYGGYSNHSRILNKRKNIDMELEIRDYMK